MSEEKKKMFEETVENLKHLDEESLRMMKFGSALLRDRDELDRKMQERTVNVKAEPLLV